MDPMLITRAGAPSAAALRSRGRSFWVRKKTPLTLVSITLSQPTSGKDSMGAPQAAPALFTRMSSLSSFAARRAARDSMPLICERSAGREMQVPP